LIKLKFFIFNEMKNDKFKTDSKDFYFQIYSELEKDINFNFDSLLKLIFQKNSILY
jgi:hypothetical protein